MSDPPPLFGRSHLPLTSRRDSMRTRADLPPKAGSCFIVRGWQQSKKHLQVPWIVNTRCILSIRLFENFLYAWWALFEETPDGMSVTLMLFGCDNGSFLRPVRL